MFSLTKTEVSAYFKKCTIRILLWFLVVVIFGTRDPNFATPMKGDVQRPISITDIDAITNEFGTTLYLLDLETRTLYRHQISANTPDRLTLNDFEPFPLAQSFQKPTALTHKGNSLFICDQLAQSIYEIDTQKIAISEIVTKTAIGKPVSIAVSRKGTIVVGDDDNDSVIAFEPIKDGKEVTTGYARKPIGEGYDDPDRLIFIGDDLFVLETEHGRFSLVSGAQPGTPNQNEGPVNSLLAAIKNESSDIQDLTYLNGVFYVVSQGRVVALTPVSSYKSFPIFKESSKPSRGALLPRIVASRDNLFLEQANDNSILRLPRPVPVSVNFEPDSTAQSLAKTYEQQRSALLFLYEYLIKSDALPTREVTTGREYVTLKELLFEQHVLIDPNYADQSLEGRVNSDKRLTDLICKYNAVFCEQPDPLTRRIPASQSFILPNVPMESDRHSLQSSAQLCRAQAQAWSEQSFSTSATARDGWDNGERGKATGKGTR